VSGFYAYLVARGDTAVQAERYGKLDVLVNNGGITYDTRKRPSGGVFRDGHPLPWLPVAALPNYPERPRLTPAAPRDSS
jgi:hypothetical protein